MRSNLLETPIVCAADAGKGGTVAAKPLKRSPFPMPPDAVTATGGNRQVSLPRICQYSVQQLRFDKTKKLGTKLLDAVLGFTIEGCLPVHIAAPSV